MSRRVQFLDVPHRSRAGVEGRGRTNKVMSRDDLTSAWWEGNRGRLLAQNLAVDLDVLLRLVALRDVDDMAYVGPDVMCFRPYRPALPASPPAPAVAPCSSSKPGHELSTVPSSFPP